MKSVPSIEINLDSAQEGLRLWIDARKPDSLFDSEENAKDHLEARFQIVEGCSYDFQISNPGFLLGDVGENIVQQHKRSSNLGTISPNIFVGKLSIPILEKASLKVCFTVELEVQSIKSGYRDDYRYMLEIITEKCTDLLLKANSPVSHHFETDYTKDSQSLYQKFAFIKSVISTTDFAEAIQRVVSSPVTKWTEITDRKDIRKTRRFSNSQTKELLKGNKRITLPESHYLRTFGLESFPEKIRSITKTDSVDTPENRFIKNTLENFLKFCTDINAKAKEFDHSQTVNESELLIRELEDYLNHAIFKLISKPTTLKLNSPVLQRKEGYRDVLRVWLMFDLAAKLIWTGGDDIYRGGKKDIATLYEYWLFFKLLDLFTSIFKVESKDIAELIQETPDGLNLQLKQGKFTALFGIFDSGSRKLNVRFNYNRSFSGNRAYPDAGSWTTALRADYTLSFWPFGINEFEAEKQELIVHVHFDAKYKIANLGEFLEPDSIKGLDIVKDENRKGIYKNADLLKMHAYKDAIRRTGGAYVIYPGDISNIQKGFHEIIPGLGAFAIKPSKIDSGINELKDFIHGIIEHFISRTSQREKMAFNTFDIYKNSPKSVNNVNHPLPEPFNSNRDLIPDYTFVLIGYYKSQEQYNWIQKTKLYNFRMGSEVGSLVLDKATVSSKYLLLHTRGEIVSGDLWKIVSKGPKVFSKEDIVKKGYPNPTQDNYLVIEIEAVTDKEFENVKWDIKNLENYSIGRASALPFTASLTELMKNSIK